ncbi:MAG: hypothetical protein ACRDE8_05745 [Ginsengibacter sp.]
MTERIDEYLKQQSCANICCVETSAIPYCFSCFYAYNSNDALLYFKSPLDARHSKIILINPAVAGTVMPDKLNKLHVRGIQFEGTVLPAAHPSSKNAAAFYYKKNPAAVAMPGEIWTIQINTIKFTDNRLGFGKKLIWSREEQEAVL